MADTVETKKKRKPRAKPIATQVREEQFLSHYLDEDGDTYLNGTQSMLKTEGYNISTYNSAGATAAEVLKRPSVAQAIREHLDQQKAGDTVRLDKYVELMNGYRDPTPEGKEPVSAKIQLEALKRLDKLAGVDDMRKLETKVLSDRISKLSKQMLSKHMKAVSPTDE